MIRYVALCLSAVVLIAVAGRAGRAASRYTLITILHTNDMHGSVMPRDGGDSGLTRIATLVRQIRAEMPNVLLMDAGDIIHGTPEDYLSGGRATVTAMDAAGYQLAAAGNHEFDFGLGVTRNVLATAQFPFVAANIRAASGGQWDRLEQYTILDVDGVRVGVIGLATLETITLHWPSSIKDIAVADPLATAEKLIPELRSKSDVVVVLSHLGDVQDVALAKAVPGIDFIVGGHSHTAIADWRWVGGTLITQAGAYARALGRIDFIVKHDENGAKIVSVNGGSSDWSKMGRPPLGVSYPSLPLIPVDRTIPEDEAVRAAYMPFREAADRRLSEVIGQAPGVVPGRATSKDESPAGDLVADAVRAFAKSDIALIDANSVAANGLPAGQLTARSAFELIGGFTRQQIVVARVSGEGIVAALNNGFTRKRAINAAVSGLSLTYEIKDDAPMVSNILVGGQPLDPQRKYTVAAQAYVMMDLMAVTPDVEVISDPPETTREAIAAYIKSLGAVTPAALDRIRRNE